MNEATQTNELTVPDGIGFRIETRVSYVNHERGIEVPLGYEHDGEWRYYELVESAEGLCLSPEELIGWLEGPNSFGEAFLGDGVAESAVEATLARCIELSKAAEAGGQ